MRTVIWPLVAALGMAGGLVVLGPPAAAPAADGPRVQMVDNEPDLTNWHFDPAEVTVPAGATVVWLNKGKEDHTVTADDRSFDSGMKRSGASFQRAFPKPGKYAYHCAPHPWMKGTVRVVGTATAAAAPAGTEATAAPVSPTATTAAPAPAATKFPASLAAPTQRAAAGAETTSSTSGETTTSAPPGSAEDAAAPLGTGGKGSGGNLPGTVALVMLPTLAGLAIGAKLRQSKS